MLGDMALSLVPMTASLAAWTFTVQSMAAARASSLSLTFFIAQLAAGRSRLSSSAK